MGGEVNVDILNIEYPIFEVYHRADYMFLMVIHHLPFGLSCENILKHLNVFPR